MSMPCVKRRWPGLEPAAGHLPRDAQLLTLLVVLLLRRRVLMLGCLRWLGLGRVLRMRLVRRMGVLCSRRSFRVRRRSKGTGAAVIPRFGGPNARFFGRHGRGRIRLSGSLGGYYAASAAFARACRGGDCWCAVVFRGEQSAILAGGMFMLRLRCQSCLVRFARGGFLLRRGVGSDTSFASVKRHVGLVVDHNRPVDVDVGHVDRVHMHHSGVVEESSATPFTADT